MVSTDSTEEFARFQIIHRVLFVLPELVPESPEDIEDFHLEEGYRGSHSNLAWLVTPALFALGVIYVIYKCCRDGLCNCKRLRRRAGMKFTDVF